MLVHVRGGGSLFTNALRVSAHANIKVLFFSIVVVERCIVRNVVKWGKFLNLLTPYFGFLSIILLFLSIHLLIFINPR